MTQYLIKLVDHDTGMTPEHANRMTRAIQDLFNQVFEGTPDSASLLWGKGTTSDNIVLHFVANVTKSYLQSVMPGKPLALGISGHTRLHNRVTCSEFYRYTWQEGDWHSHNAHDNAKNALHEVMHNVFPAWSEEEIAKTGGLGLQPAKTPITELNKQHIRKGIAIKNIQQL